MIYVLKTARGRFHPVQGAYNRFLLVLGWHSESLGGPMKPLIEEINVFNGIN